MYIYIILLNSSVLVFHVTNENAQYLSVKQNIM